MTAKNVLDPVAHLANQLGEELGPHRPWAFVAKDEATGKLTVFSNQTPDKIRALLRYYLKGEAR